MPCLQFLGILICFLGYGRCFFDEKKAPTNKTKLDRILARQPEIRGSRGSKYRLVIPLRESIKGDKMFNDALNQVFKFNQNPAKTVRTKQHDDAPDSLAGLFTEVLGATSTIGYASSTVSREMLGI